MTRIAALNKTTSGRHVIIKEAETTVVKATLEDTSTTDEIIVLVIEEKEHGLMTATTITVILVSVKPPDETIDGHRVEVGAMSTKITSAAIEAAVHSETAAVATETEMTATVRRKHTAVEEGATTGVDKMKDIVTTSVELNKANGPIITNNNMTARMAITSHLLR